MPKVQLYNKQYTITIPFEYIKLAKLDKGDIIAIIVNERGNLEFEKVGRS